MLTIMNMSDFAARILRHAVAIRASAQGRRAQHHESDHQSQCEQVISALVPAEFRNAVKQCDAHDLILRRHSSLWIVLTVLHRLGYWWPVSCRNGSVDHWRHNTGGRKGGSGAPAVTRLAAGYQLNISAS